MKHTRTRSTWINDMSVYARLGKDNNQKMDEVFCNGQVSHVEQLMEQYMKRRAMEHMKRRSVVQHMKRRA